MYKGKISDRLMIAANQRLKERDYWTKNLSGELEKIYFHYDKLAAAQEADEAAYQSVTYNFENELGLQLMKLSNNADFRLHMILVAAVVALLHKYTGHPDIIVGSPIYKQEQDIEFINTVLAFRNQIETGMTFKKLLLQVRQVVLDAIENQNYPIEILVENLGLHTPGTENPDTDFPLFDVMIMVENIHDKKYIRNIPTNTIFSFLRKDNGLHLELIYNTQRYEICKIHGIITHLTCLLREVLFNSDKKISSVAILSPEEKKQILFEFNHTQKDLRRDRCYHQLFEEQAASSPDRIAAIDREVQITYNHLNEKANQAAGFLIRNGVKENHITAIHMNRSIYMLTAILGVFKAGAAYLGIDVDYPEIRVRTILEDSEAHALITEPGNLAGAHQVKKHLPHLNTVLGLGPGMNGEPGGKNPGQAVTADSLAYIIYTSGTTGKPKGVMIHQLGMLNHLHANIDFLGITGRDIIAQTASLSFDISVWQFLAAVIMGGITYIIDSEVILDTNRFIRILQNGRVTILEVVPSLMKAFLERIEQEGRKELTDLRWMIPTGETLSVALARQWYRHYPRVKLVNAYGPAEASDDVTLWVIDPSALEKQSLIPIGKPLQNFHIYIMDPYLSLCPVKVPGEICIAGIGVGKGYLKDPEKTKASFVPNPYVEEIGSHDYATIYKSGDMGYFQEDGNIIFLGRKDHQVKVRGFRIELEEIENQLLTMEEIKETVVMVKGESSDRYLCAYIVPALENSAELSVSKVRDYLSVHLPYYMVPSYCMFLDKLPLTPNGKIDRKALPLPELKAANEYIPPGNKLEETLVEICAKILEIDPGIIGMGDNFFELGGHSLKATLLVSEIHKAFEVKIPLAEIFVLQTLGGFAAYIEKEAKEKYIAVSAAEKKEYYILSSAQRRLYLLQQLDLESIVYNMPQIITVEMEVERKTLETTFRKLIQRHESFRTSFLVIEDQPVQRIFKPDDVEFRLYHDDICSAHPTGAGNQKSAVDGIIARFIRPFDLAKASLLRAGLIRWADRKYILMMDLHHIVSDGISQDLLTNEFISLYTSAYTYGKAGEEPSTLRIQYKDYSEWRHRQMQEETYTGMETFWLKEFAAETPLLNLPTDYLRPTVQNFAGSLIPFQLGEQETRQLNQLARAHETTLFMILTTVYYIFLHKMSSQEDIVVGTPVAGRDHTDLQQIIGIFINTLPLRHYPSPGKIFTTFLNQVKERTLKAFENQSYPFEELVEKAAVERDLSRNPLFDTMFILQNQNSTGPSTSTSAPGTGPSTGESNRGKIAPYSFDLKTSKFDLTLTAFEVEEKLYFTFQYCTRLFKQETVSRFIQYLKKIVSSIIETPQQRIGEIDVLTDEEKKRLLLDFNDTTTGFPGDKLIHQLFEKEVERIPDHVALLGQSAGHSARHCAITYRELNQCANRLAHRLKEKHVCSDTVVALLVDRSIEMMIGILAVMKAGGAYLPLDPDYPPERTSYILEDSDCSIILTGRILDEQTGSKGGSEKIEIEIGSSNSLFQKNTQNLATIGKSTDLAYVIYTSGSTGRPKGVMIQHRCLANFIKGITDIIDFNEGDRILSLTTISFDIFGLETILPLTTGSLVIIGTAAEQLNVETAGLVMVKEDVTILQVTPSRLSMLLADEISANGLKFLKYLLVGGEAFPESLLKKTRDLRQGKIYNMFGPTETTIWSTVKEVTIGKTLNIGKPIANTGIYILDKENTLLPLGVAGELCISGEGLARGYINIPELTAEKFILAHSSWLMADRVVKQVTSESPMSYIYKTGDLARWLPDGNIEFLGRQDDQVKIRGFRIELAEIESQLGKHKAIKESAVTCRGGDRGDKYICAYFVPHEVGDFEKDSTHADLREYLSSRLPNYMIPSYFIPVEEIPLTPNGKVNRKALPQPEIKAGESYIAPRNELEKKLTELWAGVLGANTLPASIGIDDNFFHLGGNSLSGTILLAKIHKELQVKLPLTDIFKTPTIRGLTTTIQGLTKDKYESIEPTEKKEYYALSSAQRRFYILQQMDLENTSFNISEIFVLEEKHEQKRITDVFRELVKRHDIFRMSFEMIGDEPFQRIYDGVEFGVEYHRIKEQTSPRGPNPGIATASGKTGVVMDTGGGTQKQVDEIIREFIRPFDLNHPPLLRVGLIEIEQNKQILMLDIHHIVMDGLSMGLLLEEFLGWYIGKELSLLRIQYKDFSEWQNSENIQQLIKKQESYWLKVFENGIPVLNLPTDYVRPAVQSFEGKGVGFEIGTRETIGLKQLAREGETTLYMVILAVFNILLSKICGQETIPIGTGGAGRGRQELQQLLGTFQNMVVLINYPTAEKTFMEFLKEVNQRTLEAFENQDYQFEELVKKVTRTRDASRNPLFDVFLILNNMDMLTSNPAAEKETLAVNSSRYFPVITRTRFDLGLYGNEAEDKLTFFFEYCSKLFKKETIEGFIGYAKTIMSVVLENKHIQLKNIKISHVLSESKDDFSQDDYLSFKF